MIDLQKYDFYIFDCDGVILDSNNIKSIAFAEALVDEPSSMIEEFIEYHKKNGGISRYEKFRYYFEEMKKSDKVELEIKMALYNYANIIFESLLKCNYIPGVIKFIEILFKSSKTLFVVSGSDEKELKKIFRERSIDIYFNKIYGSPINKIENTKKVLDSLDGLKNGVFFGDSQIDYKAAKNFNIEFIYVKTASEWIDGSNIIESNNIINDFNIYWDGSK